MKATRRALLGALPYLASGAYAQAKEPVDMKLVLGMDVSVSVLPVRFDLQVEGYASALLHPLVIRAITSGRLGRIAMTFVQWSGFGEQRQMIPWTTVGSSGDAAALADSIRHMDRAFRGSTCIERMIYVGTDLINSAPFSAPRNVIDISGDGRSSEEGIFEWERENRMRDMEKPEPISLPSARARALARGIVINGLPILGAEDEPGDLLEYYEQEVIGGHGSFALAVERPDDTGMFSTMIRSKMRREIVA